MADDWETLAGRPIPEPSMVVYFLRKTVSGEEYFFADNESGLTLAWSELTAAVASQVAYGGSLLPLTVAEAVAVAQEQGVAFMVRTPDGDFQFHPVQNRCRMH
jgi:hypothetical protein